MAVRWGTGSWTYHLKLLLPGYKTIVFVIRCNWLVQHFVDLTGGEEWHWQSQHLKAELLWTEKIVSEAAVCGHRAETPPAPPQSLLEPPASPSRLSQASSNCDTQSTHKILQYSLSIHFPPLIKWIIQNFSTWTSVMLIKKKSSCKSQTVCHISQRPRSGLMSDNMFTDQHLRCRG